MGDAGAEDLPDRAALWRQRCGQHYDRGECGVGGGHALRGYRRGTAAAHPRRWFHSEAAGYAVPDLLPELTAAFRSLLSAIRSEPAAIFFFRTAFQNAYRTP